MASIFSRIISGGIPGHIVHQDECFVCLLDIAPACPGHVLVIPRVEAAYLADLPTATLDRLGGTLAMAIRAVKAATGCPAVNVLINDGPEANQAVPHAHIHIIPRTAGDGRLTHPKGTPATTGDLTAMLTRLRSAWT